MAFHIPSFPLLAWAWYPPAVPPVVPDLVDIPCNLVGPGKRSVGYFPHPGVVTPEWIAFFPKGTDLRDKYCGAGVYYLEIPGGSGRYYEVIIVDDVAKGFANEYRVVYLSKTGTWPTPIP